MLHVGQLSGLCFWIVRLAEELKVGEEVEGFIGRVRRQELAEELSLSVVPHDVLKRTAKHRIHNDIAAHNTRG